MYSDADQLRLVLLLHAHLERRSEPRMQILGTRDIPPFALPILYPLGSLVLARRELPVGRGAGGRETFDTGEVDTLCGRAGMAGRGSDDDSGRLLAAFGRSVKSREKQGDEPLVA
jgi:hypothetical protein